MRARRRFGPAIARRHDRLAFRVLTAASNFYLEMVDNVCWEMELNGELWLLEQFASSDVTCIFDVGANVGDWSIAAARRMPRARIEAFEIVPDTARRMAANLAASGLDRIRLHPVGLSDSNGTAPVAYFPHISEFSSAAIVQPGEVEWRDCEVRTGDAFCEEHGIEHIDLVKIDVEGLEGHVLKGFARMLAAGAIDAIQFEYGHLNASVRFLLGDFYDLLQEHGYRLGKMFPDHVLFHEYNAWRDERFRGPNYIAVHRDRADLIARLSARA